MPEFLQDFPQSHPFWTLAGAAVVVALAIVIFIYTWGDRANIRRSLRALLGKGFHADKSYISSFSGAIALDERALRFAYVNDPTRIVLPATEIIEATCTKGPEKFPTTTLTVLTSNETLPQIDITTLFRDETLREICSRLNAMRDLAKFEAAGTAETAAPERDELVGGVKELTQAILALSEAVKHMNLRAGARSPSDDSRTNARHETKV